MYLNMRIPLQLLGAAREHSSGALRRRDGDSDPRKVTIIAILAALVLIIFVAFVIFSFRASRRNRQPSKNSSRGGFLKIWNTGAGRSRYQQAQDEESNSTEQLATRSSRTGPTSLRFDASANQSQADSRSPNSAVNRNTSIRSVMTLPAYRVDANDNEQVLGREGERGGVDVVIEYPTEENEEELRDQEMEALYQIRLARRQELAEREERRRERREARDRGDHVALENIRTQARNASNNSVVGVLREEHERIKAERQRNVSSVSYADLGVARHDGTRIRANSQESERMGLLSDAASIAADTRAGSSPEIIEADVGEAGIPIYSPPGYDEVSLDDEHSRSNTPQPNVEPPPTYPGPSQQRADNLASDMADLAAEEHTTGQPGQQNQQSQQRKIPQLPSLRLQQLPQIVIEPSSARPRDDER
uniref:Uncharacterized protein n=1 Tax=Colletotrichum fructicola (strain Nara gc5) TaxID=1213859 RepID=L2FK13_COLFN